MNSPASSRSKFLATVHHNYEGCVFIGLSGWTLTDPVGPRLMIPKTQMPPTIVAQIESGTQQFRVSFLHDDLFKFGQWEWQLMGDSPLQSIEVAVPDEDANVEVDFATLKPGILATVVPDEEDVDYGFDPETDGSAYQSGTLDPAPPAKITDRPVTESPTVLCDLAEVHFKYLGLEIGNHDSSVIFSIGPYGSDEVWDDNYRCNVSELPKPMQDWVWNRALKRTQTYCTVYVPDGMLGDPGEWEFDKIFNETPSSEAPYYETVNHPAHYNWHPKVECIDVIEEFNNVNVAFAIKHLWRLGQKPGVDAQQDLDKAIWYLTREKQRLANSGVN